MEALIKRLGKASQEIFLDLLDLAKELDKGVSPHMLIGVNEEGFMVKHPGPSEYVSKWLQELVNRKDFYAEEELVTWLKQEREQEIKHLERTHDEDYKKYYLLLLRLIRSELDVLETADTGEGFMEEVEDLMRQDDLQQALSRLAEFLDDKEDYSKENTELIMHQARLAELQRMQVKGVIGEQSYFTQKSKIRLAILSLLNRLS